MKTATGYLGLGSNVGDRESMILEALRRVEAEGIRVVACSSLYETEPAEGVGGGNFVNAVAEVRTLLCPEDLLNRLKTIEKSMGRKGSHNRPREIDIDILCLGETVLESAGLTIPHPRFGGRVFVLLPLQEIAPDFRCPLTGRKIDDMVQSLGSNTAITRISGRHMIAELVP